MLQALTCPHCGADLHLQLGASIVRCEYCQTESRLEALVLRAPVPVRGPTAAEARATRRAMAFVAGLGLLLVTMAIAIAISATHARSGERARAARYQADVTDLAARLRAAQGRLTDASRRNDPATLRSAQAELSQIQDELSRRQQDYLRGR